MFDEETYTAAVNYVKKHGGDYDDLTNKPQINGNALTGNKTSADLGIQTLSFVGDALVIS